MVLLPVGNWLPYAVKDAVALDPEPDSVAVPREMLPTVNATVPVGVTLLEAVTLAVSWVLPLAVKLEGLAETVVVLLTEPLPQLLNKL